MSKRLMFVLCFAAACVTAVLLALIASGHTEHVVAIGPPAAAGFGALAVVLLMLENDG